MASTHSATSPFWICFPLSLCFTLFCTSQLEAAPHHPAVSDQKFATVVDGPLAESLKCAKDSIERVTSVVSKYAPASGNDFRLSNAISDCLDLLDLSSEELNWTLSSTQTVGKTSSCGYSNADMVTWLGAALDNQDTCIEGFEQTNSFIEGIVASSVNQVTSLLYDTVKLLPIAPTTQKSASPEQFPQCWMSKSEKKEKLLRQKISEINPDVTVATDGSGQYKTVMEAVSAAPEFGNSPYVIYVKSGVYKENVVIKKKKWNIALIGDGMESTVISGDRNVADGWTTFRSATVAVNGRGFMARDISFENTAGPEKNQAVALRSDSDLSVFYRCGIFGYQDTLYAHSLRQFYRECRIAGTVDFIFGDATVVFQKCHILVRKGLPMQQSTITAQGRKDPLLSTGFSIQSCNITADDDLQAVLGPNATASTYKSYLGRPWKMYSRTVVMQSYIGAAISPQGWLPWNASDFALATLFYGEYKNNGPSSGLADRVKWPGFQAINHSALANNFTVAQFIDGNMWLPSTGVTFVSGLSS